jgi:hypothetical protein
VVPWKETASGEALQSQRRFRGAMCSLPIVAQRQQRQSKRFAPWLPCIFGSAEPYLSIRYLSKHWVSVWPDPRARVIASSVSHRRKGWQYAYEFSVT